MTKQNCNSHCKLDSRKTFVVSLPPICIMVKGEFYKYCIIKKRNQRTVTS